MSASKDSRKAISAIALSAPPACWPSANSSQAVSGRMPDRRKTPAVSSPDHSSSEQAKQRSRAAGTSATSSAALYTA